jgi:hypothetical protein
MLCYSSIESNQLQKEKMRTQQSIEIEKETKGLIEME